MFITDYNFVIIDVFIYIVIVMLNFVRITETRLVKWDVNIYQLSIKTRCDRQYNSKVKTVGTII
jgi:hypothetical protein